MTRRAHRRRRLATYRGKRDFRSSPEPRGRAGRARARAKGPIFVVQEHDASRLHYDFRLEVDGVLRSWAVPKGPSTNPAERRLAVQVEDHPLAYADFEGVIPEDQYGAGPVIVWDTGRYRNVSRDADGAEVPIAEALARGRAEVWLEGAKLRGPWALVRTTFRGKKRNWLLVKAKGEGADARRKATHTQRESVLTGRTVEDVRAEAEDDGDD